MSSVPASIGSEETGMMKSNDHSSERAESLTWIGAGIAIGLIVGLMIDNLALGFALGVAVGAAIDALR